MTPNLMSERVLKNTIVTYARGYGWLVHHDLPSQRANGSWATVTQGDSGYPDLVLVHPGNTAARLQAQIIYAELKTQRGKLTAGQQHWLDALQAAGQTAVVWRPNDLQDIFTKLRTPLLY
jgi:hypothetical protein